MSVELLRKLQVKQGQKILVLNAPEFYEELKVSMPSDTLILYHTEGQPDMIQLFVKSGAELSEALMHVGPLLLPNLILWIMYPKKSSGIVSDLDMMSSWQEPQRYGLRPVSSVSVNSVWTALRFKPADQVKKSIAGNTEIQHNELGKYIDVKNRTIIIPEDLKAKLESDPESLSFFESLAWSHKKEYIVWILSAKQEKTRLSRIDKAAAMLALNKKNPSAK